jgi:AcrR family transcriptional regulator
MPRQSEADSAQLCGALPCVLNHGSLVAPPHAFQSRLPMPYRRTENVARRLAARRAAIIAAAREAASEGGMTAVQIAPVAQRAGIAAGTVYRYFPGKTDLVAALLAEISRREIAALRRAADVAPGPLSALSAAVMTFAAHALRQRRLAFAAIAEPVEVELDDARMTFRKSLATEFASRIAAAVAAGHLPEQDAMLAAAALLGLLVEGLIGPLAPDTAGRERAVMQSLTLIALRALGVADARARGLVVQTVVSDQ